MHTLKSRLRGQTHQRNRAAQRRRSEMRPLKDRGKPWTLRDVGSSYDYEKTVGEGVYGEVFQATEKYTRDARALKRVKTDNATEREGFPITALREANVLKRLAHENVVTLHEVLTDGDGGVI